ncbi:uncharacterized protein TNCV_3775211 [Trichonephila clavipes]|nr:uncharacterized protein TNCV_3775211 [Trichonephila clavipes]
MAPPSFEKRIYSWLRILIFGDIFLKYSRQLKLWLTYNDSSFENNTIAPINEPDLFARCEVAVQTDPSEDIVHEDVTHQNNAMSEAKSLTSLRTPQNALTAEDMSDLPDLCIETSNCTENCLPEGNFLCNLSHLIAQRIFSRDTRIQTDDATPRRSRVRNHELLPTVTSYIFSNRIP